MTTWYARYPQDFIMGTIGMDLETRGAYSLILDLIYDRDGRVPDEPRWIAGVLNVSVRKWNTIRQTLLDEDKISVENGYITNFRADYEIEKSRKLAEKRAENGAKGGNKTAEKTRKPQKPAKKPEATLPGNPHPHLSTNVDKESIASEFEEWWQVYPKHVDKKQAKQQYLKARGKVDKETLVRAASEYARASPDRQFQKSPMRWLRDERWTDEPDNPKHSNGTTIQDLDRSLYEAAVELESNGRYATAGVHPSDGAAGLDGG